MQFFDSKRQHLSAGLLVKTLLAMGLAASLLSSLVSFKSIQIMPAYSGMEEQLFLTISIAALFLTGIGLISEYTLSAITFASSLLIPEKSQVLIMSGFTSGNVYIVLSFFIVACVIQKSQIFQRMIVLLLLRFAHRPACLEKLLFLIGLLMTPILSVQSTRVAIMAPVLDNIVSISGYKPQGKAANAMANAAFSGCVLLSTVFLTGKSSNYLLFSAMSSSDSLSNAWLVWLSFAAFPGILLVAAFFLIHSIAYKAPEVPEIKRFSLLKTCYKLGPISAKEYASLLSIAVLIASLALRSILPVHPLFIALLTASIPLCFGLLRVKDFSNHINWKFICYLATMIGIMKFINGMKLPLWIAQVHNWLSPASQNIFIFIFLLFALSWLLCIIFGTMIAPGIAFTLLAPVLASGSVNQWIIAFVILMATESWIFPYQSSYFLCFKKLLNQQQNFELKPVLITNALLAIAKIAVIYASIPYWRYLGLL
ncbi:SLC13 family permease [Legionella genomosp. 1]|uniref:SLC13 family permease n=1 Tax=Legionella genomosp. 1 TaxID=1093625 RepID=UPI001054F440|nr:anion permease [Legionella genomosp. 1]